MSDSRVIAITVGQNDLQVLAVDRESGNLCRVPVDKDHIGSVHQALLNGSLPYRLWVPDDPEAVPDEVRERAHYQESGKLSFGGRPKRQLDFAQAKDLGETGDASEVWLIPPRLCNALQEIRCWTAEIHRIIFFDTDRRPDKDSADYEQKATEPTAVTPLLKSWLQEHAGVAEERIQTVAVLVAEETLLQCDPQGNVDLLSDAAERMNRCLYNTAQEHPQSEAWLYVGGGIPEFRAVAKASAQFYFPDRVQYRSKPEKKFKQIKTEMRHTAVETLQARRRARDLVQKGEFQAAAALAREFLGTKRTPTSSWAWSLQTVARYFQGYLDDARIRHRGLGTSPRPQTFEALMPMLDEKQKQAFHIAMRAEAALRAQDYLFAASLTITFYDVSLFDGVNLTLRQAPNQSCVEWRQRAVVREHCCVADRDLLVVRDEVWEELRRELGEKKAKLKKADVKDWWTGTPTPWALFIWQQHLLIQTMSTVGKNDRLSRALKELSFALEKKAGNRREPADFRDTFVHSSPTQQHIEDARKLFLERDLWARHEVHGLSFLAGSTRASNVLNALGIYDVLNDYERLVQALTDDIEQASLIDSD